ncbi:MAG: hypothetical protein GY870_02300 [archaeon]|nr:hypothetical protein [archaeon]
MKKNEEKKKRIIENYVPPDVIGDYYVINENKELALDAWIALEEEYEGFYNFIIGEIEYHLKIKLPDSITYCVFHVDRENNDKLIQIKDQEAYSSMRNNCENRIKIIIIHKAIDSKEIENHPKLQKWLTIE